MIGIGELVLTMAYRYYVIITISNSKNYWKKRVMSDIMIAYRSKFYCPV